MRNVLVHAPAGSGRAGIAMTRKWPGPALLEDVRITGFARGIDIAHGEYSMTGEDLRLSGQREVGIVNRGNVLALRRLVADGAVPAVRNEAGGGLVTLLDSRLTGGGAGVAIENEGAMLLRGVSTVAYAVPIRDQGQERLLTVGGDWSSEALLASSAGPPMNPLPIDEDPPLPAHPESDWLGAPTALPEDDTDDTAAIQAALNSGKPVVYLRSGRYEVSATLRVPATVEAIVGFDATINAKRGIFAGDSTAPVLLVDEPSDVPLVVAHLSFTVSPHVIDIERASNRPLALRHLHFQGMPLRAGPGSIYLTDVAGGTGWRFTPGQQVWARQLNVEQRGTKIVNEGAQLWVLGLKTEQPSTVLDSSAGAYTEILGGLLYPVQPVPTSTPAFRAVDASLAVTVATTAYEEARNYDLLIEATGGGASRKLMSADMTRRGFGSMIAFSQSAAAPP